MGQSLDRTMDFLLSHSHRRHPAPELALSNMCNMSKRDQLMTQQKEKTVSSCCCPLWLGVGYSKHHLHRGPLDAGMQAI